MVLSHGLVSSHDWASLIMLISILLCICFFFCHVVLHNPYTSNFIPDVQALEDLLDCVLYLYHIGLIFLLAGVILCDRFSSL